MKPRQLSLLPALTPPVTVEVEGVTYDFVFLADGPEYEPRGLDTIPPYLRFLDEPGHVVTDHFGRPKPVAGAAG